MSKDEILRLLRVSTTGYLSGAELAGKLGVSRTAVWKQIKALERDGFRIEAVPSKGYRLTASPDRIVPGEVTAGLGTLVVGREVVYRAEVVSTNTLAVELAQAGAADGTAVVAESQTGGKGRLGRTWVSPSGNLALSVILRPAIPTHQAPLVTLMGAVATALAVRDAAGVPAGIKWPNDILVNGRKVGGLLTELSAEPDRVRHLVLGIGINVNMDRSVLPSGFRDRTTTLSAETGGKVDRTALLRKLLRQLDHWYRRLQEDAAAVREAWTGLNVTLGKRVAVSGAAGIIEGTARAIDAEGRLVLSLDSGSTVQVAAGDVTIIKKA